MKQTLASKQICEILNSKSTKPQPKMSFGISQIERFRIRVDLVMLDLVSLKIAFKKLSIPNFSRYNNYENCAQLCMK